MIRIEQDSLYSAVKAAYKLIADVPTPGDPDIAHEATAIFTFPAGYASGDLVQEVNQELEFRIDVKSFFSNNHSLKIVAENEYWNQKLLKNGYMHDAIAHLKANPASRSCLVNFWDNNDFATVNPKGACITQLYFRIRNNEIEMHSHCRANDVHRCLIIDLAYIMYVHSQVAREVGVLQGQLVHFVDALHTYTKCEAEFQEQLDFICNPQSKWGSIKI